MPRSAPRATSPDAGAPHASLPDAVAGNGGVPPRADRTVTGAVGVSGAADAVVFSAPAAHQAADEPGASGQGGEIGGTPPVSPRRAVVALTALAVTAFLFVTNEASPLGLIGIIARDLDVSESQVGLLTTSFALVVMLMSVPLAFAAKRLPRREVLVAMVALLTVGLVVVATADGFGQIVTGRVIAAIAHAGFWAVVTPAAAGMFPLAVRGRSVSRLLLGPSAVGIIGLPAVTWLALNSGWRTPFWVLAGAAVVMGVVIAFVVPRFHAEQGTVSRGEFPSKRIFIRVLAVCGITVAAMGTTWTFITPFATEVGGFSDDALPGLLFVGGIAGLISMFLVARYLDRFPVKAVALGLALLVAVWSSMGLLGSVQAVVVIAVLLQGFAWSVLVASMVNWAIRHAPGSTDIANAAYATVFNAGNALGSVLGAVLLAAVGAGWLPVASLVLTIAAALVVWSVRGSRGRG